MLRNKGKIFHAFKSFVWTCGLIVIKSTILNFPRLHKFYRYISRTLQLIFIVQFKSSKNETLHKFADVDFVTFVSRKVLLNHQRHKKLFTRPPPLFFFFWIDKLKYDLRKGMHPQRCFLLWITICFVQTLPLCYTKLEIFCRWWTEKIRAKNIEWLLPKGLFTGRGSRRIVEKTESEWRGKESCKEKACSRLYGALWISLYNVLTVASKHLRFSFFFLPSILSARKREVLRDSGYSWLGVSRDTSMERLSCYKFHAWTRLRKWELFTTSSLRFAILPLF